MNSPTTSGKDNPLTQAIAQKGVLLADGATGTNLFAMGLQTGDSPELWNVDHPDRVRKLYANFIEAGSDLILTNTFGGTRYRLGLHDAAGRVAELNQRAAELACDEVKKSGRDVLVAGSMGPTGEILQPNGPLSSEDAMQGFREQAEALVAGGVDVLWVETMSAREEIVAAMQACSDLPVPVVFTVSIDTNGRTMMGITAHDVIELNSSLAVPADAVGTNCGVGAAEVLAAVNNLSTARTSCTHEVPIVAKANCGVPEYIDGEIVYNGTPEIMASYARLAADAGASIIGGCCGTTPDHLRAMRAALDTRTPATAPNLGEIIASLGEVSKGATAQMQGDLSVAAGSASGRGARRTRRRRSSGSPAE